MKHDIPFHPVNDLLDWTHPEDLKAFKKDLKNFVYTKKGEVKKDLLKHPSKLKPEEFIRCTVSQFQSAHRLDAYMSFRSFTEFPPDGKDKDGNGYGLDPRFYIDGFKKNCFEFFGIKCCECCGEIIEDTKNPDAYERFCKYEKEIGLGHKDWPWPDGPVFGKRTLH